MKLTETKNVEFEFELEDANGTYFKVTADRHEAAFDIMDYCNLGDSPAQVAKHMRNLANNLIKVAAKLEGIK